MTRSGLQREGLGLQTFGGRREGKAVRKRECERLQRAVNRERKHEREVLTIRISMRCTEAFLFVVRAHVQSRKLSGSGG